MRTDGCWRRYKDGFPEIMLLVEKAATGSTKVVPGAVVSEQQILLRAAVVLLAGHVEGFFSAVAEDFVDDIKDVDFTLQEAAVQRYVSLQCAEILQKAVTELNTGYDDGSRLTFHAKAMQVANWLEKPSRINSSQKPRLRNFYQQGKSAKSLDRYLTLFGRQMKFFDWVGNIGGDRTRYVTVLEGLITARNEIAHGNEGGISLGVKDVRDYLAVITVMLRLVRAYLK